MLTLKAHRNVAKGRCMAFLGGWSVWIGAICNLPKSLNFDTIYCNEADYELILLTMEPEERRNELS